MKQQILTLDNKQAGELELNKDIFGLPIRIDILHRAVEWQRSKARSGTHKTKEIGDVQGTTKKPWRQKGTGNARAGSLRSPQFRGGAVIFGPVVRSHEHTLTKKFRKLALKTALSAKLADGKLKIIKDIKAEAKLKTVAKQLKALGFEKSVLFIDGANVDAGFAKAINNMNKIDALPTQGANVYDILNHDNLVLTEAAVKALEERLK